MKPDHSTPIANSDFEQWLAANGVTGLSVQYIHFVEPEVRKINPADIKNEAWTIDEKETGDKTHVLYLKDEGDNWWKASVKWDGCLDIQHAANSPFEEGRESDACDDCTHVCDLDGYIDRLQKLKDLAKKFFVEDWK